MIDALVAGVICSTPSMRTSKAGKPYAVVRVRAAVRDGESLIVSVIAFSESAVAALRALEEGDSAALAGELTIKTFVDKAGVTRPSLDLLAHAVLSIFHVNRRRAVLREAPAAHTEALPFDDELPAMEVRG